MSIKVNINSIKYHRNGVSGTGFYAIDFTDAGKGMLGVVFCNEDDHGTVTSDECRTAVFDKDLLAVGEVGFPNRFRGGAYEPIFLKAINDRAKERNDVG